MTSKATTRVLVTGAGGLLGQALAAAAAARPEIELLARSRAELDITSQSEVAACLERERPAVVINAAAYTQVDAAEAEPAAAVLGNVVGPAALAAETARRSQVLIHISTDHVFAGDQREPYDEDAPLGPRSVYGQTKADGERWVRRLQPRHYVVRTAGLFGQGGRNFVTAIAERALRGEALRVVGDQICQRTYAPDLAAALLELAVTPVAFGTFHVTNEGAGSWYSFAEMVVERLGREVALQPVSTAEWAAPAWRPAWSVLSGARWSRVGMTPLRPVEEAVAEYLESWLATRPT